MAHQGGQQGYGQQGLPPGHPHAQYQQQQHHHQQQMSGGMPQMNAGAYHHGQIQQHGVGYPSHGQQPVYMGQGVSHSHAQMGGGVGYGLQQQTPLVQIPQTPAGVGGYTVSPQQSPYGGVGGYGSADQQAQQSEIAKQAQLRQLEREKAEQVRLAPKSNLPEGTLWEPQSTEKELIDKWYRDLDDTGGEQVGGAKLVNFLKKSNLSKDILRSIWDLADPNKRGFVNRDQFILIMRLVSIACSPIYAGSKPSIERYKATIKDEFTMPALMTSSTSSSTTAAASLQQTPMKPVTANTTTESLPVKPAAEAVVWTPSATEQKQIDQWFSLLDIYNTNKIGGPQAVGFLITSGLDRKLLRDIWEVADSRKAGSINKDGFAMVIRLLEVSKRLGRAATMQDYTATVTDTSIPLPFFSLWKPSDEEQAQIDAWYDTLDEFKTDKVGGAKIVNFLRSSGVDRRTLRDIWGIGDIESKGYITRIQFTLVIRMVALVDHKHSDVTDAESTVSLCPSMQEYYSTANVTNIRLPFFALWNPSEEDKMKIQKWYADLDENKNMQVGGAKIVQFLLTSHVDTVSGTLSS